MKPKELTALFPIGGNIELSAQARAKLRFIEETRSSLGHLNKLFNESFPVEPGKEREIDNPSEELKQQAMDLIAQEFVDNPYRTAISISRNKERGGLGSIMIPGATSWEGVLDSMERAVIYADIATRHSLSLADLSSLVFNLSKVGSLLVTGYDFTEAQLDAARDNKIPDTTEGLY